MIKVLIADDHPILRQGLKQILAGEFDSAEFGEAENAQEVMDHVGTKTWDVLILDITMPGRSGLDLLKDLKQQQPKLPVLVLSMHPEEQLAVRALKAGADGYLTKNNAPEELVRAIKKVLGGGVYVSASLAEELALDLRPTTGRPRHAVLTDREFEVLCLIASGKKVSEIANELSLSVKTISTYRARILDKMRMKSNAELTRYAIGHKLVGQY
jgi:DNA-binding NarL/FixJ family response regulator